MSKLIRDMQKIGGVPSNKWVIDSSTKQNSENAITEQADEENVTCPFCGDHFLPELFYAHYMCTHHADETRKDDEVEADKSTETTPTDHPTDEPIVVSVAAESDEGELSEGIDTAPDDSKKPDEVDFFARDLQKYKSKLSDSTYKRLHKLMMERNITKARELLNRVIKQKRKMTEEANVDTNTNFVEDKPSDWLGGDKPAEKVTIPPQVRKAISDIIKVCEKKAEIANGRHQELEIYYIHLRKMAEELNDFFDEGTVEAIKNATVYLTKINSQYTAKIPAVVWDWLATGQTPNLKSYFNVAKKDKK